MAQPVFVARELLDAVSDLVERGLKVQPVEIVDSLPHGGGVRRINAPEEVDIALEVCAVEVAPRVDERTQTPGD